MYMTQALSRVEAQPTDGRLKRQAYPQQTLCGRGQHGCQDDGLDIVLAKECDGKPVLETRGRDEEVRRDKEKAHTSNIYKEIANMILPRLSKGE